MTTDLDLLAILAATAAAFVSGGIYYALLGERLAAVSPAAAASGGAMPPWMVAAELARCLVLAAVVGSLAARGDVDTLGAGLALGLGLWVGFPLVLWTGAILHERTPLTLAAIHGGDWLVKLVLIGAIVAVV